MPDILAPISSPVAAGTPSPTKGSAFNADAFHENHDDNPFGVFIPILITFNSGITTKQLSLSS
jgi:hypothetical protein